MVLICIISQNLCVVLDSALMSNRSKGQIAIPEIEVNATEMVAIRSIKGFLFVLILAVTSTILTPLFLGPTLILLWLKPRWFRFINDSLVTVWLGLPVVSLYDISLRYCCRIQTCHFIETV